MARKKHNIHYLYKTTCNVTGRYYIGMHSTSNIDDGYMGSGLRLRRSIRKYGAENHTKEILEYFDNRELLVEAEKKAITEDMINDDNCMNLMVGGKGGFVSEKQQKYRSSCGGKAKYERFRNDEKFAKICREIASSCMKNNHKEGKIKYNTFEGKLHSDETKKLISERKKRQGSGEENSQYGTCWITKDGLNKKIKKDEITKWLEEGWVKGRK